MKNILDITNHSAIEYNNNVNDSFSSICSPLFESFPITHFFYIKFFNNGSCLYLCNDTKWVKYYIEHNFQNDSLHMKCYRPSYIGYSLWSGFKKDKVYSAIYDFNVWNGFNIYEKQDDGSLIMYAFGTSPLNEEMNNFYINNLDVFKNFIAYFKSKALFINSFSELNKLTVSKSMLPQNFPIEENNVKEFYQKINPYNSRQFIFRGQYGDIYLTKSEIKCLYQLASGKTAKEIGKSLGISHRTIEYYIGNIKMKTGLRTKAELIRATLEKNSLNQYEISIKKEYGL